MERAIALCTCMLLLSGCAQMAAPPLAMPHQDTAMPQHAPPGIPNATQQQAGNQSPQNMSANQTSQQANNSSQMPLPNQANASTVALPPMGQWALEAGTRVPEGVSPSPVLIGGTTVLYYTGIGGIFRASSQNGIDFGSSTEVLAQASNSAIFPLKNGGYRMIYNDMSVPAQPGQKHPSSQYFLSAYSANGLDWEKESGIRFRSPGSPDYDTVSVPCVVDLGNGTLRMYFVGDMYARDYGRQGNNIRSAISGDEGLTWLHEPGERISGDSMDPAVRKIGNYYRLYYTVTDFELDEQKVYSALSSDGLNFTKEGVVLQTGVPGERLMDPDFLEENGTLRMYVSLAVGNGQSEETRLVSAVGK